MTDYSSIRDELAPLIPATRRGLTAFVGDQQLIDHVLDRYCEWLNSHLTREREDGFSHKPTDFSLTGYGWTKIPLRAHLTNEKVTMFVLTVSDGDEGGPATLTCWFDEEYERVLRPNHADLPGNYIDVLTGYRLRHAVQEFDTQRMMLLNTDQGVLARQHPTHHAYNEKGLLKP